MAVHIALQQDYFNKGLHGYYKKKRKGVSSSVLHQMRLHAINGNVEALDQLIVSENLSVDQPLRESWSALMYACSSLQIHVAAYLIEKGSCTNYHKELFTPLMAACSSSADDELHQQDPETEKHVVNLVHLLRSHGADVNASERHKMSPLMFAAKTGKPLTVECLLGFGASVSAVDNQGYTALHWACQYGHGPCARLLLGAGALPKASTNYGQTPGDLASSAKHHQLAEIVECWSLGSPTETIMASPRAARRCPQALPPASGCPDLEMVLAGLELGHLSSVFAVNKVNLGSFLRLTDADLETMGVSELGIRKRLLSAVAGMHARAWEPSSLPPTPSGAISLPESGPTEYPAPEPCLLYSLPPNPHGPVSLRDALLMFGNVERHLTFLEATVEHVRLRLQTQDASASLRHDTSDASLRTLTDTLACVTQSAGRLAKAGVFLGARVKELGSYAENKPADLVTKSPSAPYWQRSVLIGCMAIAGVAIARHFLTADLKDVSPHDVMLVLG